MLNVARYMWHMTCEINVASKLFKGTVPQNISPLKSGCIGCIDLWNVKRLQKYP